MTHNVLGSGIMTEFVTLLFIFITISSILQSSTVSSEQISMPIQLMILVDYSIDKNNTLKLDFIVQAINMYDEKSVLMPISDPWVRIYSGNKSIYECSYSVRGNISIGPHSMRTLLNTTITLVIGNININKVVVYSGRYIALINSSYYYEIDSSKTISIDKNRRVLKPEIHGTSGIAFHLVNNEKTTSIHGMANKTFITYRVNNVELLNRKSIVLRNMNQYMLKKYYVGLKTSLDIILLIGTLIVSLYILRGIRHIIRF